MSIWDDVTGWVGENSDWLKPAASIISGAGNYFNKSDASGDMMDWMRQQEQQNYDSAKANHDAYNEWYQNTYMPAANANAAGRNRAAAAYAAARMREEEARQQAEGKAFKVKKKFYGKQRDMLMPFAETAQRMLPQMEGVYGGGLKLGNALSAYLQQPGQMSKLDAGKPAWQTGVPIPKQLMGQRA